MALMHIFEIGVDVGVGIGIENSIDGSFETGIDVSMSRSGGKIKLIDRMCL